jgi:hypothetical protein
VDLNSNLRLEIHEYSLFIENLINDLLLTNLEIYGEKEKTRLFNNKGKLTFQNKIDLLFDISVLSKDENGEFELLMNIRNKFLHDIDCNSYQYLLSQFDNGIVNRFKKYLDDGKSINDEKACKTACYKLFQKNIETIKKKIVANKSSIEKKYKLFQFQNDQIIYYIDFIHDFLEKVSIAAENSKLENPKVAILGEEILNILEGIVSKLNSETKKFDYEEFFNSDENIKSLFGTKRGLTDIPKWSEFKLGNDNKSSN